MSTPTPAPAKAPPVLLELRVPPAVAATCQEAAVAFDKVRESVQTSILEVPHFTSKYISSKGLGLDGCLQMAFQLAHYQLHGASAATYESANQV